MAAQNVCITKATLFLFHETTAEYESFGLVHCAVVGAFAEAPAYKLGCYRDSQDYICICDITSNNDLGVCLSLQGRYAYFRDSQKRKWSLEFSDVTKAEEFCANVAVAMYGVSNQLSNCLVSCDVGSSGSGKRVSQGDKVTCTYTSWVVQRGGERSVPKLGSLLESKVEVTIPSVPANHFCVTSAMLGFEGSIIGMEEGGQRFVIIPSGCMQGSGPKVNTCYFLSVIRREAETPSARSLVKPTEPTTVSTGFSREQFLFVDRLRDQVFTLTEKLRETRRQLDSFSEGVNAYADQASPKGIRSAQVEYSLKKVMDETVETVDAIAVRRSTLSVMRERNESLQAQLAKLMDTRKNLSSEVVHTQNNQKDELVLQDQKTLNLQDRLSALSAEQDDLSRHLATLKSVLNETNSDLLKAKNNLQVLQLTNRATSQKVEKVRTWTVEELERRNTLRSQTSLARENIDDLAGQMRLKKETIEEKQTKMKGDKAQYLSMMEEERVQSLSEIAELRKELVAELTRCDERYDEEIGKASTEAFQRGRDQGFADGQSGANQENELSAQQLTITIQRLRAEEEALRQRLLSVDREEEKDAKSLTKQLSSLSTLQRELASGNAQAKAKLDELERVDSAERANVLFELRSLFSNNPTPFTHRALLSVVDCLARGVPFDASVLKKERDEELRLLEEEKTAVGLWARSTAYNTFSTFPPIRPFFRCDEPHSLNRGPSVLLKIGEEDEESQTTALQRRYQQAISQLNAAEPTLALVP